MINEKYKKYQKTNQKIFKQIIFLIVLHCPTYYVKTFYNFVCKHMVFKI